MVMQPRRGVPLLSTLNDSHGIEAGGGAVPTAFFQGSDGSWHPGKYDDHYVLRELAVAIRLGT
jgi:hypothetical protein